MLNNQVYSLKQHKKDNDRQPVNKSTLSDISRLQENERSKEQRQGQNQIQYNPFNIKTCNPHPNKVNADQTRHLQSNFRLKPNKFIMKTGNGTGTLGSGSLAVSNGNQNYNIGEMNGTSQSISQPQLQKVGYLNSMNNGQYIQQNSNQQNNIKSLQNIQIQQNNKTFLTKDQVNFNYKYQKHHSSLSRQINNNSQNKSEEIIDEETIQNQFHDKYQFNDATIQLMNDSQNGWNKKTQNTYDNHQNKVIQPIHDHETSNVDNLSYMAYQQRPSHRSQNMNFDQSTERNKGKMDEIQGMGQMTNTRNITEPNSKNNLGQKHQTNSQEQFQIINRHNQNSAYVQDGKTESNQTSIMDQQQSPKPQMNLNRKVDSPLKTNNSPRKIHQSKESQQEANNNQHSRLVKKKNGVIYKQHLLTSTNQQKIIKQTNKQNLRESLHFPNMPMVNQDYPVNGIGFQNQNHNSNQGIEQTLTMRSSVYDLAKTKNQQIQNNIQNMHQNLKILNNSQSNWKKRITQNGLSQFVQQNVQKYNNHLEKTPVGLINQKIVEQVKQKGIDHSNKLISGQIHSTYINGNYEHQNNNQDTFNGLSINMNNNSRSTSHQHSFQSLPELPELSELPEIPLEHLKETFESINEQDEINDGQLNIQMQSEISQKQFVPNRNQLPKLVNLPSTKNGQENKIKMNNVRVKNNFNHNNGMNNVSRQSRNPNIQHPTVNLNSINKNITPTTNMIGGNQFNFNQETEQQSFNDSVSKNQRVYSKHSEIVKQAYNESTSIKNSPQKTNSGRPTNQPTNSKSSLNKSISIQNGNQKSRQKINQQQSHKQENRQSPNLKHHINKKEQNQTQREKAKQYDTIGPSIGSNELKNCSSIQSIQIVDEKLKTKDNGKSQMQKVVPSQLQKVSNYHIQLDNQEAQQSNLNDSVNLGFLGSQLSRIDDQSKLSSQYTSIKIESDRRLVYHDKKDPSKLQMIETEKKTMVYKNRDKLNLTPSEFQTEIDQKLQIEENRQKQKRNSSNNNNNDEYQGIRIQISKEKKIKQHLVENPVFCSEEGLFETNKNTINQGDQCPDEHQLIKRQFNPNTNSNTSLQLLKDKQQIELIGDSEDPSNNLLFYNFNAYNVGNKNTKNNHQENIDTYNQNQNENHNGNISRQSNDNSKPSSSKISLRSRDKYSDFETNRDSFQLNNEYKDDGNQDKQKKGVAIVKRGTQNQAFKDRQIQSAQSSKNFRNQSVNRDKETKQQIDKGTKNQIQGIQEYDFDKQRQIQENMRQNLKTHYSGNEMMQNLPFNSKDIQLTGQFRSGSHAQPTSCLSTSQKSQIGLKTFSNVQDARQTQTTMAGTSATAFQGVATLEIEEVPSSINRPATRGGSSSLPRIIPAQDNGSNASSAMNFGRNTLYNPKKSTDFFDLFQAGDALATSAAAANLVRPSNKAESRRGSSNSHLGRIQRKNIGQFGFGLRSNSRKDNIDSNNDSFGFGAIAKNSTTSSESQNYELQNFVKSLKQSHQNHNRRKDFPSRKSACGSTAMSKVSSSMGSLKGHHSVNYLNPIHQNLKKVSPQSPNNVGNLGENGCQINEMIEEEVEFEDY